MHLEKKKKIDDEISFSTVLNEGFEKGIVMESLKTELQFWL